MQMFIMDDFLGRYQDTKFSETKLGKVLNDLVDVADPLASPIGPNGPWVGAGSLRRLVRGEDPLGADIDFFFRDEEQLAAFETLLARNGYSLSKVTTHHKEYTKLVDKKEVLVQCIFFKYYHNVDEVIDSFDFTISQFAYDGRYLYTGDYTLFDTGRSRLQVHKVTYPVSTVRRMLKYGKQGYTICNGTIATVLNSMVTQPELARNMDIEYVD